MCLLKPEKHSGLFTDSQHKAVPHSFLWYHTIQLVVATVLLEG